MAALEAAFVSVRQGGPSAVLLGEPCGSSDDDVREAMSGNVCRCGAYPGIVAAIQSVRASRT